MNVVPAFCSAGLTIRQHLSSEIDLLSEYEYGSDEFEYKNHLIDARTLIDVFDRVGDSLNLYCSSMQKKVCLLTSHPLINEIRNSPTTDIACSPLF